MTGRIPHSHDWSEVESWSIDDVAAHWVEQHNNSGDPHPVLTVQDIRTRFRLQEALAARRDHQQLHLGRRDGTEPTGKQLDFWLRPNAVAEWFDAQGKSND